jgi:hypothetical protein
MLSIFPRKRFIKQYLIKKVKRGLFCVLYSSEKTKMLSSANQMFTPGPWVHTAYKLDANYNLRKPDKSPLGCHASSLLYWKVLSCSCHTLCAWKPKAMTGSKTSLLLKYLPPNKPRTKNYNSPFARRFATLLSYSSFFDELKIPIYLCRLSRWTIFDLLQV